MEGLGSLKHLLVTVFIGGFSGFMVIPAITDVTMEALCPGQDECSLAIYLSGINQGVAGVGSVVMTPLIGNLSDVYGRKALLTIPLTLSFLPLVVLAYSRDRSFVYAYYALKTLAGIFEGATLSLSLAYVADNISEGKRGKAFGVLVGVGSAAFVCGTLSTGFLSIAQTFQVAALLAMAATVYMRIFLHETTRQENTPTVAKPLLQSEPSNPPTRLRPFSNIPSIKDIKDLLTTSKTFTQVAFMVFFNSLADGGLHASLMYFLKARFHFSKNQYSELMLIIGIAGMVSQLFLMPLLEPRMGELRLLRIGLFVACTNMFLYSIAWEIWITYIVAGFTVFVTFTAPCTRSIVSKEVGPSEQGKAQGCISAISSMANIISPLIFSPLTATFLSDKAPFYFPGFSLLCVTFCMVSPPSQTVSNQYVFVWFGFGGGVLFDDIYPKNKITALREVCKEVSWKNAYDGAGDSFHPKSPDKGMSSNSNTQSQQKYRGSIRCMYTACSKDGDRIIRISLLLLSC